MIFMQVKTLTFFSNYYNHHQKALCDEWYELLGEGFTFVQTMPMESFRAKMGWGEDMPSYVLMSYLNEENEQRAKKLADESDLVVMGTAPEYYIEPRLDSGKIIFRYSERPLKEGFIKFFIPRLTKKYLHMHVRNRNKNIHILGASAFTALDYKKMFGSYPDKCYKFGYFPKLMKYDIDELMKRKEAIADEAGAPTILWEGRMLKLKRPDLLVKAAKILKSRGYDFVINFVGEGEMRPRLEAKAYEYGLSDMITFDDFLSPEMARERMSNYQIYVMTSNFWEGWGSVIYEALNAGCAVVASHACGATPWLVSHGRTGFVFKSGSAVSLADKLEKLLSDKSLVRNLGINAYTQMTDLWNPIVAARRVISLAESIENKEECPYTDGPCSKAEYVKNSWFAD